MIQKLLLVRVADMRSDLLTTAGFKQFAGEPLNASPVAWHDEHGLSHYGFVLKDMTLADFRKLEKFAEVTNGVSIHDYDGDTPAALAAVGLRINESAKE